MIGEWLPHYTAMQTYMRRRIFGLFWQYRVATDDESRACFRGMISQ
jgi:hypothetical protein